MKARDILDFLQKNLHFSSKSVDKLRLYVDLLLRYNKKLNLLRSGNISTVKKQSLFERILFFLRGNMVFPDMKLFWRKTSVNFLEKYLLKNQIQTMELMPKLF